MQPSQTFAVDVAGGLDTLLPQGAGNAGRLENVLIDRATGGWSTRIGYEPYVVNASSWTPFGASGPITSLHVAQALASGARQHILFEEGGNLHLLYEAGGTDVLRTVATGRAVPTPADAASWYTTTSYGTVITNGVDRPILVKPWPLGDASESANTIAQCVRPFGFDGLPTPPAPRRVRPLDPVVGPTKASGAGAMTLWSPSQPDGTPGGGRWGLGYASNPGTAPDKQATYGWAVSFISDTGSEGPISSLSSTGWELPAGSKGFHYGVAVDIPIGPKGTVARKIYRTANYASDAPAAGDTTLYLVDIVRNNVETLFFDANPTNQLGQPSPEIATGPLPSPAARFSALWQGCLWLDGGVIDSRTLFYSTPGLIEQFSAASFIELSGDGGGITGLYASYTSLLVFRENGIDVVQGDPVNGFTVTTISNSVTCRAPHTIAAVPGLGVVFLALDGVYAIIGGLEGGAVSELIGLTARQDEVIGRITPDCHARAVACWSAAMKEYQLYVPVDGSDRPELGLVLHAERLGNEASAATAWSTRIGFPVGAVSTLFDGTVVFGHHTGAQAGNDTAQRGLFVVSGKRALGKVYSGQAFVWAPPPTSRYRSAWVSFGSFQILKQLNYIIFNMLTTGEIKVQLRHFKDFNLVPILEQTYFAQPPDAAPLPVLGKAVLAGKGVAFREARLVPLRFSAAQQSAAWLCFEIETDEDVVLIGFEYDYETKGTRTIPGVKA
jgi:hypothetical protein